MKKMTFFFAFIALAISALAQSNSVSLPNSVLNNTILDTEMKGNKKAVETFMQNNKLSVTEYSDLNIAGCKHKLLRTLSNDRIAKGTVFFENKIGKAQVLYGVVDDKEGTKVYLYLFTIDKNGKYIDSIYAAEGIIGSDNQYSSEEKRFINVPGSGVLNYEGVVSTYGNQIFVASDGGSFSTETIIYILTPSLKFNKAR